MSDSKVEVTRGYTAEILGMRCEEVCVRDLGRKGSSACWTGINVLGIVHERDRSGRCGDVGEWGSRVQRTSKAEAKEPVPGFNATVISTGYGHPQPPSERGYLEDLEKELEAPRALRFGEVVVVDSCSGPASSTKVARHCAMRLRTAQVPNRWHCATQSSMQGW